MTFPLPPNRLPGLEPLLAGSLWHAWAERGTVFPLAELRPAVGYVRLKPDSSCRLTVFANYEGNGATPPEAFLLYLFPDADRARESYEKELTRKHVEASGWKPFLDETHAAVGVPFPNDPELPELRRLYEPDRFRRALVDVLAEFPETDWRIQRQLIQTRVLAYKPGRRAVFRVKVKLRHREADEKRRAYLHAKLATESFAQRSFANLEAVHDAAVRLGGGWQTPAPCGRSLERPFIAAHWVDGESLAQLVAQPKFDARSALARAGAALAALHRLDLHLDHVPSPVEEGERLIALAEDLGAVLPDEQRTARRIADSLACGLSRLALAPSAIVHGDFHPGQVIVKPDGVVLVDFDQAGRGYAAADLGDFCAQLEEDSPQPERAAAFLRGYESAAAERIPTDVILVATAAALFRRAAVPFRTLRPDWPSQIRSRLSRCDSLLREVQP